MNTLSETQRERREAATEGIRSQVRRLRTAETPPPPEQPGIDIRPTSAYEAVTRQMVESLADDLKEIKGRLNNLLFLIAGAILMDVIGRMIGIGT